MRRPCRYCNGRFTCHLTMFVWIVKATHIVFSRQKLCKKGKKRKQREKRYEIMGRRVTWLDSKTIIFYY